MINYPTLTMIKVKLQIAGVHRWPAADSPEYSYLQHPHRHVFHIEATKQVSHDDRDIEIISFKRQIFEYLINKYWNGTLKMCDFDTLSCEAIGRELLNTFALSTVEVLEDNENGCFIINELI